MSKIRNFFVETTQQKSSYPHSHYLQRGMQTRGYKNFKDFKLLLKKQNFQPKVGIIKFDLLNIFYTVVSFGSISSASKRLSLTQPAITLCLQKLEKEIGCLLFVNSKHKKTLKLTPFGLLFFNYIQRVLNIILESFCILNSTYSSKFPFLEQTFQLRNIKLSFKNNLVLSNIVKPYSFYSNFNFSIYKNFNNSLTKILKFIPHSYQFYDNKIKFLILSKNYFLTSKLNNTVSIKNIELNKFNEVIEVNKNLFSFIIEYQFIEVETIFAFQTCNELKISEIFCWGTEV